MWACGCKDVVLSGCVAQAYAKCPESTGDCFAAETRLFCCGNRFKLSVRGWTNLETYGGTIKKLGPDLKFS